MTDPAVWSERTDSDYQKRSAHPQEKSHQYLEGLGDKKTLSETEIFQFISWGILPKIK